jgi:hypothetical protein
MAFVSGLEKPLPDAYMDGYDCTEDMLGLSSTPSKAEVGTTLDCASPGFEDCHVSEAYPEEAMQSILDIFQLEEDTSRQSDGDEMGEGDAVVDMGDRNRRTERLKGVCSALDQLWWTGSDLMVGATEKLADGSRDRKSFRTTALVLISCIYDLKIRRLQ